MKKQLIPAMIITLLFVVVVSVSFLNILGMGVNAQEGTVISVFEAVSGDSTIIVGEEGVPLNATNPTPPFTVNVTVSNVNNLYAWGIILNFRNTTLNCTEDMVWLPQDHVFSHLDPADYVVIDPDVFYDDPQYPEPRENPSWVVSYGITLMDGAENQFSGSGTLFQINFTGIAAGTCSLTFQDPYPLKRTDLKTFDPETGLASIEFSVDEGSVQVIHEFPTFAITPLLIILTLVIVVISKRTWSKKL